ncbi:MAG TPA: metal-dependent hydrolase [Pyrinomonadaceae bacterium]|nr:metal-dependent hydrolase [Pyrinomonadaceae bacterium]
MDNLTHSLVGLTAARAGLERLSPGATVLCVIAASSPDCDVALLLGGDRWTFLQHHRGITHAIVGVAVLALLLPVIFYGVDRMWARFRNQAPRTNFRGLLIASLIVTATHPLLDWTNNYGIRFFLPWSPKWSYGDLVFIVDPYLWLILGGAAFLLSSKTKSGKVIWGVLAAVLTFLIVASPRSGDLWYPRFVNSVWIASIVILVVLSVIGAGRRFGNKIAFAAIGLALVYWCFLGYAHSRALVNGQLIAEGIIAEKGETVRRLAAMPTLASPLHWDCVFETDSATYRFRLRLLSDNFPASRVVRYEKPSGELAELLETVSQQRPAQVFLGFARFPVAQLADPHCTTQTLVQLADLRYTEPGRTRGSFGLELPVDCPPADEVGR